MHHVIFSVDWKLAAGGHLRVVVIQSVYFSAHAQKHGDDSKQQKTEGDKHGNDYYQLEIYCLSVLLRILALALRCNGYQWFQIHTMYITFAR